MYSFSFWFGVALAIIGCLMLFYSREHAGTNEVGVFGMHFRLSHPALVIFVLGVLLVIREGDGAIQFDVTDAEEQRVPSPDSPTDPAPDLSIGSATGVVAADTTVPAPAGNGAAATALDSRPAPQPSTYAAGLAPSADAVASVDAADAASNAAPMEEVAVPVAADIPAADAAADAAAAAAAAAATPTGGENPR